MATPGSAWAFGRAFPLACRGDTSVTSQTSERPWGFALEFYDPIGGLRMHYPANKERGTGKGRRVDGSGQLPSGEQVNNEADLRKLLASRKTQLTRNLTHKLLLHATGRKPSYRDHHIVNQIVEQSLDCGNGFRDLIHTVIASELFARR